MSAKDLVFVSLTCTFLTPVKAQVTTATVLGTVRDASGAVVVKAGIEAKAVATNLVRSTATDDEGNYILMNLPVGEYEITASASGFKKEIQHGIWKFRTSLQRFSTSSALTTPKNMSTRWAGPPSWQPMGQGL